MKIMYLKTVLISWVLLILSVFNVSFSFAYNINSMNSRVETLMLLKIIDSEDNLDSNLTRAEFSKIVIKASAYKDNIPNVLTEAVCNDVSIDTPYASYIKKAIEEGYMFTYLDGTFKPYDLIMYSDLTRACLSLLSYTNEDFRGNQVIGRNLKFEKLGLNENIDKKDSDIVSKADVINAIYNTLKENVKDKDTVYGVEIFDKIILGRDKELNANEYKWKNVEGPFFAKSKSDITAPFEITNNNVYINAVKSNINDLNDDIISYGYAIYYLDVDNKAICAYTERQDVSAPIVVRKGYIYKIYYAASNMLIPYRVDIDDYKYMIDSEETKFAFSASGSFKEDDYIVYLCNKINDVTTAYIDEQGNKVYKNDEEELYNGSVIMAFNISEIK